MKTLIRIRKGGHTFILSSCLFSCSSNYNKNSMLRRINKNQLQLLRNIPSTSSNQHVSHSTQRDDIDVLDEQGIKTGKVLPRKKIHELGKIHRAIHLYLFEKSSNKLLLQKRSNNVDHYPGMFSISITGHVDAGEDSMQAVKRELKEELGVDPETVKIDFLFSHRQDAIISPTYIDRQFNDIYVGWANFKVEDIQFDPTEVSEVKLIPFSSFERMVTEKEGELAPVYEEECKLMLSSLKQLPLFKK